ncbi:TPA: acyl--CoA ligase [Pseudomonas putida]|uniref:2-succinylbenzoate--CoA ligase n=1 Tax=Achromobacter insolitus TaxID=217204 RepID=A0A6S7FAE2_9BURK|nr:MULTISPECIES: class I adenylate-forming enzyme family protein [Pseudomonadota]MDD2012828.1 acyl--CoA ligase [Pseudomonas putida]CAB3940020.1 2-succinylbenzoate--CoA ligase [Achromobacter insolitus]CAB3948876.1 2-succinylbenzoate--CoA ligase [Achromobacter insolitus]HDS1780275.1 acyl--CoA ligase [Pseudomonas putida]
MKIEPGLAIATAATQYAERTALVTDDGQETYFELNRQANKAGSAIADRLKIPRGSAIGVLSYNRREIVHCWLGFDKFGFPRVALHAHLPIQTHIATLRAAKARVLVFDVRFAQAIAEHLDALKALHLVGIGAEHEVPGWATPFATLLDQASDEEPHFEVDDDAPYYLQPTSGTTGMPKLWEMSHRAWLAMVSQNLEHLDSFGPNAGSLSKDDVCLHFHSLQWCSGAHNLYPHIVRGARNVILDDERFDPGRVVDAIVRHGVTNAFVPGPLLPQLLDEIESRGGIEHCLRRLIVFFATPELLQRTSRLLGDVWCHAYGVTEMGGVATRLLWSDVEDDERRWGSIGRPASFLFQLDVVNDLGERQAPGEVGEIRARSPMSRGRYVDRLDLSALDANDWFKPRDLAYMDECGFAYYVDRCTDVININGRTVYPHTVEEQILAHPSVRQCGVVAVRIGGVDRLVAGVALRPGAESGDAMAAEIRLAGCKRLKPHETLHAVFILDELPTVLSGAKVRRADLQAQLTARHAG